MPQLAGLNCSICTGRIASVDAGQFCPECRQPVHTACAGPVAAEGTCPVCGASSCGVLLADQPTAEQDVSFGAGVMFEWLSFRGRASRSQYFTHSLISGIVLVAIAAAMGALGPALGPLVLLTTVLFGMWSEMSATVRRLHDLDRPGWHWVLGMIPLYNLWLGLELLLRPGTIGDNRYGPDPLLEGAAEADRLLLIASRHEMDGDWSAAFDTYRLAAEKLEGHPGREYAIECIRRLHEKMATAAPAGH